jgi:hypothetical protein
MGLFDFEYPQFDVDRVPGMFVTAASLGMATLALGANAT